MITGLGLIGAAVLGFALLSPDNAYAFGSYVYPVISLGAGLLLMAAARRTKGTERLAWGLTGLGVAFWGVGETVWVWYSYVSKTEVPYPGWADAFYLAAYPAMFVGVLLMPHLRLVRYERLRLTLDAIAGSVALAAIMWSLYLADIVYLDPEAGIAERFVNVLYPIADVFLLIAVLILAIRRTTRRFDPRLLIIAGGLIVTALADIIYVLQVDAGTYVDGGRLDGLWLLGYTMFAFVAYLVTQPSVAAEEDDPSPRLWQIVAPYGAIVVLFGLTLVELGQEGTLLLWASGVVAILVITRQGIAIRENQELVTRQRDDLVASVSHELRTPLTSVVGYSQLLKARWDSLDDSNRRDMVSTIEAQSSHLARLVTDLIDVARNQLEGVELHSATHPVGEIAQDALATVMTPDHPSLNVETRVSSDLLVYADRARLHQVLVNLLMNAVRYGQGQLLLLAHTTGSGITIEVHDNGPGIAKKHELIVWERFQRGAHRLDSIIPGSGIGLSIARSLVTAHGGTLTYSRSSRLGGACFRLTLPAPKQQETPTMSTEPAAAAV